MWTLCGTTGYLNTITRSLRRCGIVLVVAVSTLPAQPAAKPVTQKAAGQGIRPSASGKVSKPDQALSGVVVDPEGRPLHGARVDVSGAGTLRWYFQVLTDSAGRFTLNLPAKACLISASATGYAPSGKIVERFEGETLAEVRLTLGKGGVILHGTVLGPKGNPVKKGEAWIVDLMSGLERPYRVGVSGGSFDVALPPGHLYWIKIRCPHFPQLEAFNTLESAASMTFRLRQPSSVPGPMVKAWIRNQAVPLKTVESGHGIADLRALRNIVGDARIVGLGEATHGTHEFQTLKHRMVEFLVSEMGFSVFAVEDNFVNADAVNGYVLHGEGDPEAALSMLGEISDTAEMLTIIRWMRTYNADPSHPTKVSFRGFDVLQDPISPYDTVMKTLSKLDPLAATQAREAGLDEAFIKEAARSFTKTPRERLTKGLRAVDGLLTSIAGIANSIPAEESSALTMNASFLKAFLTFIASSDPNGARDRMMADCVNSILAQAGAGTKAILWAHNGHIQTGKVMGSPTMGDHLRRDHGKDYLPVGFTFRRGRFRSKNWLSYWNGEWLPFEVGAAPPNSIDAALGTAGLPVMALDLRAVPAAGPVRAWFTDEHPMHDIGAAFDPVDPEFGIYLSPTSVLDVFDVLIHVDRTTPIHFNVAHSTIVDLDLGTAAPSPANLDFSSGEIGNASPGWLARSYGGRLPMLPATAEIVTIDGGGRALSLHPFKDDPEKVPVIAQTVDATPYRGKTIKVSAWVRNDSDMGGIEARTWVRVRTLGGVRDIQIRRKKLDAQSGWSKVMVEITVPRNAIELAFGLSLLGPVPLLVRNVDLHS